jgi:hypothetical protein
VDSRALVHGGEASVLPRLAAGPDDLDNLVDTHRSLPPRPATFLGRPTQCCRASRRLRSRASEFATAPRRHDRTPPPAAVRAMQIGTQSSRRCASSRGTVDVSTPTTSSAMMLGCSASGQPLARLILLGSVSRSAPRATPPRLRRGSPATGVACFVLPLGPLLGDGSSFGLPLGTLLPNGNRPTGRLDQAVGALEIDREFITIGQWRLIAGRLRSSLLPRRAIICPKRRTLVNGWIGRSSVPSFEWARCHALGPHETSRRCRDAPVDVRRRQHTLARVPTSQANSRGHRALCRS